MANRYTTLRKKLIKEAITLTVCVVILGTLGLLLQNYAEDTQSEQRIKENEVGAARGRLAELKREMESGQSQVTSYNKYIVSHNPDLSLNRESATKWFVSEREQFHLVNLSITIPPFSDIKDAFPLKSGMMIKSDVKLSFGALTDNSVFAFIEEMQRKLPGVVVIQDVKITRTGDLSSAVLVDLSNHKITSIVTADISFAWLGIRPETKAPAAAGVPNAK